MPEQRLSTPGRQTHLELTAYHEAGHAVVALLLGMRILEVCIDHQQPGSGHTRFLVSRALIGRAHVPYAVVQSRWAHSLTRAQRSAVFALAGPLAEAKFLGMPLRTLGSIGDLESVHQLMCRTDTDGNNPPHGAVQPNANLFFEAEIRRTRRLLSRPPVWNAISLIAADLLNWGKLNSDHVVETLQWALGGCRQMGLFTGTRKSTEAATPRVNPDSSTVIDNLVAKTLQEEKSGRYFPLPSTKRIKTSNWRIPGYRQRWISYTTNGHPHKMDRRLVSLQQPI